MPSFITSALIVNNVYYICHLLPLAQFNSYKFYIKVPDIEYIPSRANIKICLSNRDMISVVRKLSNQLNTR